ncbi:MAG: hypothetical protein SFT92_05635 [Rickettsiales bacterium]|nr:hypothetical protein [Rickettsiales bacterium]
MAETIQDVLSALCSQVELLSKNSLQDIYSLQDAKEAKLAYDVLASYGFDVKFYSENNENKLYITRPKANDSTYKAKLAAAAAYIAAFKTIKQSLDNLSKQPSLQLADYTITFSNAGSGAQIGIYMTPKTKAAAPAPAKPVATPPIATTPATPKPANPAPAQKGAHNKATKTAENAEQGVLDAGPQITSQYKYYSKKDRGEEDAKGFKNAMSRFLVTHVASNTVVILLVITGILFVFSMAIISKGFLCPDLATVKNKAWYCQTAEDEKKKPTNLRPNNETITPTAPSIQ